MGRRDRKGGRGTNQYQIKGQSQRPGTLAIPKLSGADQIAQAKISEIHARRSSDPAELRKLSTHSDPKVRRSLASNFHTPPDVLSKLGADPDMVVAIFAAGNESTPSKALLALSRRSVALRSDPPSKVVGLSDIAPDDIDASLARNPNSPPQVLEKIANSPIVGIRMAVAAHLNTPSSAVIRLVGDQDQGVRRQALRHPHCPEHIRAIGALGRP